MDYKSTLHLPRTDFPIRPQPAEDDARLCQRWQEMDLAQKAGHQHPNNPHFVLHDGPPYANGPIHLGHAYNKIIKDIIAKSHRMMGYHVNVRPGWDCHGLPIELKVTTDNPTLAHNRIELMRACRVWAGQWIDIQRQAFKELGVLMSWDTPYVTMDAGYEAATLRCLGTLCTKGYVARKLKTVAWCYSCQTTLASAEIEYQDRSDPSVYVAFALDPHDVTRIAPEYSDKPVSLLVWTTTPWTLPLNRALMVHPEATYSMVEIQGNTYIVGTHVVPALSRVLGIDLVSTHAFPAQLLTGAHARHPLGISSRVPVIFDASVGLTEGTAVVHVAPGCGPIDYEIGVKQGLEVFCPVSPQGTYTHGIIPADLEGVSVRDAQGLVITKLLQAEALVHKGSIKHSYPHCWRCRNGLIFRATAQWFIDLQRDGLQEATIAALDGITFYPRNSKNFLKATVENRWEWCISRQRVWGVPIPALLCRACDRALMPETLVHAVAQGIEHEGIEFWERISLQDLKSFIPDTDPCFTHDLEKEQDILDVWFDSGVSHTAVLEPQGDFPADVYVEGVDQHRGWFQSSLLTSMALHGRSPMKGIFSHGYTVDEKGRKMSKSLGNVVAPGDLIKQLGTDGLRLWAASISHEGDLTVSAKVLENTSHVYRKIRNTCRFLLQNLYDFDPQKHRVAYHNLGLLDQYAYARCAQVQEAMLLAYKELNSTLVCQLLAEYCTHDLSAQYLDMVKDRLYTDAADSHARRSAQTVMEQILYMLTRTMAPILSFTAELIHDLLPERQAESVHLETYWVPDAACGGYDPVAWSALWSLRAEVLKSLEALRTAGTIKASIESAVQLTVDSGRYPEYARVQPYFTPAFLREFFIVSQVAVVLTEVAQPTGALEGIRIAVAHAQGTKCPRCWQWYTQVDDAGLCDRCHAVVHAVTT